MWHEGLGNRFIHSHGLGHRYLRSRTRPGLWSSYCSAACEAAVEQGCELHQPVSGERKLCEEIRRILLTEHLPQINATRSHRLLHPKGMGVEVPEFAKPGTHPDSG